MADIQTEVVDIHDIVFVGGAWELTVYQSPSVLTVRDAEMAVRLETALRQGQPVEISWSPDSGEVV